MAVGFVASATSGSQASVASFNIGTLGTGARCGIVFVATHGTGDLITGVTWNGVAMTRLYRAADTDTEPGSVVAYFLDNVSNGTITVSRTNNAVVTVGYAASISAASACEAYQTITRVSATQNTDADTSTTGTGASGEVAVDDGSPGSDSMRFAAAYSGAATPPSNGTNSTALQVLDSTALGSRFVRETTAGQGSRNVGFATGTTDDWAMVAVAVREAPAQTITLGLIDAGPALYAPSVTFPTKSLTLPLLGGSATHAQDGYGRSVSDGWGTADVGGSWTNTDADHDVAGGVGTVNVAASSSNDATLESVSVKDFTLTWRLLVDKTPTGDSVSRRIMFRVVSYGGGNWYWLLLNWFADGGFALQLQKVVGGSPSIIVGADIESREPQSNSLWFTVKIEASGTTLRAKAWREDHSEPGWDIDTTDSESVLQAAGGVGLRIASGAISNAPIVASFDDLSVTSGAEQAVLYAPTIVQGAATIALGLLDSGPALYAPTLTLAPYPISLGLIDSGPAVYAPTLVGKNTLTLGLLDAGPAVYAPDVIIDQFITLGLIDAGPALYAPTITLAPYPISLGLIDSGSALYAPTLDQTAGAATISLDLLDSGPAVYAPTITTTNAISLGLIDGGAATYAPTLLATYTLTLPLLDAGPAVYAPDVIIDQFVTLGLIDAGPAVYSPTVSPAAVTISLGLIDSGSATYAPTVIIDQFVTLDLLDSGPAVYTPTITSGRTITFALLDSGPTLYAPTVYQDEFVTLPLLDSGPTLYAPTLTVGAVTISLGLLDSSSATYAPTLSTTNTIALDLIDSGPAVYAPAIAQTQEITLGTIDSGRDLFDPILSYQQLLDLPLLDAARALYAPVVAFAVPPFPQDSVVGVVLDPEITAIAATSRSEVGVVLDDEITAEVTA
jgi:hypothetical protein